MERTLGGASQNRKRKIMMAAFTVAMPILNYYGQGFVTFTFILGTLLFICEVLKKTNIGFSYSIATLCFFAYFFIMRVICCTTLSEIISPSILFLFLIWGFLAAQLDIDALIKAYRILVYVSIVIFIAQEISYNTIGYRIPGLLIFLPLTISDDIAEWSENVSSSARSSGLFSEPAHFAQFLLPLLAIELFYVKNRNAYIRSIIYIIVLVLLKSGNALLGLGIVGIFFGVSIVRRTQPLLSVFYIAIIVCFALGFTKYYISTDAGESLIERTEELNPDNHSLSSGFIRVFRGYYVFAELPPSEKVFGVNNIARLTERVRSSSVNWAFDRGDLYFNGFQNLLIQNGIIGVFLFAFIIISLWRGNNFAGKCILVIYASLNFIASLFLNYTMLLYLLCATMMYNTQVKQVRRGRFVLFTFNKNK